MPTPNSAAFTHIIKRDGGIKPFDADKIAHALTRAAQATLEFDAAEAHLITNNRVLPQIHANGQVMPHIEQIQDAVESVPFDAGYPRHAAGVHRVPRAAPQVCATTAKPWWTLNRA